MKKERSPTKEQIIEAAYKLFYAKGFYRVSVDAIAEKAGVTKRTVYYHFKSKDDIIAEVLNVQHLYLMQQFQSSNDPPHGNAGQLVTTLFSRLITWAEGKDWLGSGFTRVTVELANMPGHPARLSASQYKKAVEAWVAAELNLRAVANPEELARQIVLLIEGAMALALIDRDLGYLRSTAGAAKSLVEANLRETLS
jgi:AcrR family transcriptional regulator